MHIICFPTLSVCVLALLVVAASHCIQYNSTQYDIVSKTPQLFNNDNLTRTPYTNIRLLRNVCIFTCFVFVCISVALLLLLSGFCLMLLPLFCCVFCIFSSTVFKSHIAHVSRIVSTKRELCSFFLSHKTAAPVIWVESRFQWGLVWVFLLHLRELWWKVQVWEGS